MKLFLFLMLIIHQPLMQNRALKGTYILEFNEMVTRHCTGCPPNLTKIEFNETNNSYTKTFSGAGVNLSFIIKGKVIYIDTLVQLRDSIIIFTDKISRTKKPSLSYIEFVNVGKDTMNVYQKDSNNLRTNFTGKLIKVR